jgi:hypothetical protein
MQKNLTQPSADSSDEDAFINPDAIHVSSKHSRIRKHHQRSKRLKPAASVSPLTFRSREGPLSVLDPSSHPRVSRRHWASSRATPSSPLASRSQASLPLVASTPDSYSSIRAPTPPHPEEQRQRCTKKQVLDSCQDDTGEKRHTYAASSGQQADDVVSFPHVHAIIAFNDEDDNSASFTTGSNDGNGDEIRKQEIRKNVVRQLREEGEETLANSVGFHIASSTLPYLYLNF